MLVGAHTAMSARWRDFLCLEIAESFALRRSQ
jgi:hypothetical protein